MSSTNLTPHKHTQSSQSIDEGFLNLPSPYYDEFSLPPAPSTPTRPFMFVAPSFASYVPSFLRRFTYRRLADVHTIRDHEDDGDSEAQGYERKPHYRHVHWADSTSTHRTNWLPLVSLLLFLSITFNGFLIFEGRGRYYATVPHDAYRSKELGQNYTCYHTHETVLERVDAYERLDSIYDHYWKDTFGGSDGYIYTSLNRPDGQIRKARFGMFHQLQCLYDIRQELSRSMNKKHSKRKDLVFIDDHDGLEGPQAWKHCFDYLRQTVMCNADDTVEASENKYGEWKTFGYGSKRQCRNSSWLYDVTKCGEKGCEDGPFHHKEE